MVETTSWKSHSFTFMVFGGLVMLCSIFFILGMLVGRSHAQRSAEAAPPPTAAPAASISPADASPAPPDGPALVLADSPDSSESKRPDVTFYESTEEKRPRVTEPPETKAVTPPAALPTPPAPEVRPATSTGSINFQLAAVSNAKAAEQLVKEVKGKGFPGFMLSPAKSDRQRLYRVQVGPYRSQADAGAAKLKLESFGYKPIIKK